MGAQSARRNRGFRTFVHSSFVPSTREYFRLFGLDQEKLAVMGQDGDANLFVGNTDNFRSYDNVCVRPNPFKCIRNATLSVNGSSFSTRPDAYYTGMSKLFCDGRKEQITGGDYERYPYSNSGYRGQQGYQKGWYERCKSLNTMGKVVYSFVFF